MTPRGLVALFPLLGLGLSACGSGGSHNTNNRVAFVEVTSIPGGLPVEIRLNKITFHATTPVAQNVHYDADCTPVSTTTPTSPRDCALVGAAGLGMATRVPATLRPLLNRRVASWNGCEF